MIVCVVRVIIAKNKLYWCHGYLLVQNADCRLQTADCRPATKCRLGTKCRLPPENLWSFFVWYLITCHRTTYRASRNRFSAISFHDYLYYCGIFLAHFLIKIDLNVISILRIVFSLNARVGWCNVCTDFTNVITVDVDVDKM